MKRLIFITILLVITSIVFQNCVTRNYTSIYQAIPTVDKNLLAAYGQKIYTRESCVKCHTQLIKNKTEQLISLDGLGEKYSNDWLFNFLYEPKMIISYAKMPAYRKLTVNQLNKKVVLQIARDNKWTTNQDILWNNLINETNKISDSLNTYGVTNKTEIIALIAYLQQIPTSKEFEKIIKSDKDKHLKEVAALDKNNTVLKIANNDSSIDFGKEIFGNNCVACHGQNGQGIIGPNLTDSYWLHGGSKKEIINTVSFGVSGKGMISWRHELTPEEIGQVTAYVFSLRGTKPEKAKEPQGEKE